MNKIKLLVNIMRKCDKTGNLDEAKSKNGISSGEITKYLIYSVIGILMLLLGFNIKTMLGGATSGVVVQSVFVMLSVVTAVFAIPKFINTLFMSTDISSYLVLPCKASEVTTAKLVVIAISQYSLFWGFSVPFLLGYGVSNSLTVSFWLGSLVLLLTVPAVVLSVIGILVMLLMRFVPFARNKDVIAFISVILTLAVTVAYLVVSLSSSTLSTQNLFDIAGSILSSMAASSVIVPIIPLGGMVIDGNAFYFIPVIFIIAAAFIGLYMLVANAFYLKTALQIGVGGGSSKILTENDLKKTSVKKNRIWAYTVKELKVIFKTPAFLLQGVVYSYLYPAFIAAAFIVPLASNSQIGELRSEIPEEFAAAGLLFISLFATMFGSVGNNSARISISREGQSFFIMKIIPVPYKDQIKAKRNASLIICGVSALLYSLGLGIASVVILGFSPLYVLFTVAICLLLSVIIIDVQMIFAVNKPNLNWESDAQLNKGENGAQLFIILIGFILSLIPGILLVLPLVFNLALSPSIIFALDTLLFAVVTFIIDKRMYSYCEKKLSEL